ncbi:PQQ-binding-like beta-propeller repeat protein [Fibrella sp. WM1]|uniref:outer membrane protein assembly factor BamB family protein n=1 Tax=Fibrella musci TaxID=3242485 RepID=UPI00351F96E2
MRTLRASVTPLLTGLVLLLGLVTACKKDPDPVAKNSAKAITSFTFGSLSPAVVATVSGNTITGTLPLGTSLSSLAPTIVVSDKATVSPASGVAQDFSKPVVYTVTAEDGSTQAYTATMSVNKSSAKAILTFTFAALIPAVSCTVDATAKTVTGTLPAGTDATKLIPTITLSEKATVSPASGVVQDFSKAVTYTVTAEDGTTQAYTVNVTIAKPVNNGTVYIGSFDGNLYALDALTGAKKWQFTTSDIVKSTPTVANGLVYFASGDKKLYALDAETGAKKWESAAVLKQPFAAPMVANGFVYYGGEHYLYAFDALTGAEKWTYQHDEVYSWDASPTVLDGIVYASIRGSSGGKSGLHALNAATGALKWHQPEIGISESSPAVVAGLLYAGSEFNGFKAIDVATGAIKWTFDSGLIVNSSPTIANGIVYVGASAFGTNTDNNKLYAIDAKTGVKKWEFKTPDGGPDYSSPIVADGIVYIGAGGTLYAVDAATGAKKWETRPDGSGLILSGPVVANGLVYLGINKKVYAFDAATGAKKWEYETGRGVDESSPCVLAKDGTVYHAGISGMVQ